MAKGVDRGVVAGRKGPHGLQAAGCSQKQCRRKSCGNIFVPFQEAQSEEWAGPARRKPTEKFKQK